MTDSQTDSGTGQQHHAVTFANSQLLLDVLDFALAFGYAVLTVPR